MHFVVSAAAAAAPLQKHSLAAAAPQLPPVLAAASMHMATRPPALAVSAVPPVPRGLPCRLCGAAGEGGCLKCGRVSYCSSACSTRDKGKSGHALECAALLAEGGGPVLPQRVCATVGLQNMGNACFLSAGLQALGGV